MQELRWGMEMRPHCTPCNEQYPRALRLDKWQCAMDGHAMLLAALVSLSDLTLELQSMTGVQRRGYAWADCHAGQVQKSLSDKASRAAPTSGQSELNFNR